MTPEQEMILAILAARPHPAVRYNDKAINDALKILNPKPAERERCLEDIKDAFECVEHADEFFKPRSKKTNEAFAKIFAALKRIQNAKKELLRTEARLLDSILGEFETVVAAAAIDENEQYHTTPLPKSGPPNYRQQLAVEIAYDLVQLWLVQRRDIDQAMSLSKWSEWYRLSELLFGKKTNLLAHMSRYQKGDRLGNTIDCRYQNLNKPSRKPGSK